MKTRLGLTFVMMMVVSGGAVRAQSTPRSALLVLSKRAHTLAIVDPVSLKVVARMPVGADPHEVIAAEDGTTAYVSNYGFGSLHTLAVLDLVGQRALAPVELGPLSGPHGLAARGGKIWFTAEGAKVAGRYDPATKKVDWVMGTGQDRTHMIAVSEDMKEVVTTNVSSGTVSFLEQVTRRMGPPPGGPGGPGGSGGPPNAGPGGPPPMGDRTDWEQTVVKVGNGSEGFDLSPDGREMWVGNAQDGTVSVLDYAKKEVIATLPLEVRGVNRLKFTKDGRLVLISTLGGPDVVVVDATTHGVVKRIPTGHGAAGIEMEPSGARAFVACTPDDYVAVIDLKTLTVVGKIDAGAEPDGMAWATRR
jgi:YVTN family beta-propeller protein